jgi:hypothetical protein
MGRCSGRDPEWAGSDERIVFVVAIVGVEIEVVELGVGPEIAGESEKQSTDEGDSKGHGFLQ